LRGELFADSGFDRCVKILYHDRLSFTWNQNSPDPLLPAGKPYAIRWRGWLKAPRPGTYTLMIKGTEDLRFQVNGEMLPHVDSGEVNLGEREVEICIRFRSKSAAASVELCWSRGPEFQDQPIAADAVFPTPEVAREAKVADLKRKGQ
jgi:hypothetical protein